MAYIPGDFILTKNNGWINKAITLAQSFKYKKIYAKWDHGAVIIDPDGTLIEAVGSGVRLNHIDHYLGQKNTVIVHIEATDDERKNMVHFAQSCLGHKYGVVTDISIFISLVTGSALRFSVRGQNICTGLIAQMLERGTYIFDDDPICIKPADLAIMFHVDTITPQLHRSSLE